MLPKGFYRARATGGEFGVTPTKGTDFVRVAFRVVEGQHAGGFASWDGYFTENTTKRTVESLKHCGCTFPDNDVTNLTGIDSQDVSIEVEHETYQTKEGETKTRARVAWVNSLSGGVNPEHQMDAGHKAAFAAKMKGVVLSVKAGKAGAPAAAAAAAVEDKIPF